MLRTTPIADMKTNNEVEPALMKDKGNPVGGIEPLNTSYCTMILCKKKEQIYCSLVTLFSFSS